MLNFFYLGRMDKYHLMVPTNAWGGGKSKFPSFHWEEQYHLKVYLK